MTFVFVVLVVMLMAGQFIDAVLMVVRVLATGMRVLMVMLMLVGVAMGMRMAVAVRGAIGMGVAVLVFAVAVLMLVLMGVLVTSFHRLFSLVVFCR